MTRPSFFLTFADAGRLNPRGDYRSFMVKTDGSGLRAVSEPVSLPGSSVVSRFTVAGPGADVLTLNLPGTPMNTVAYDSYTSISEIFLSRQKSLLQLTNFRRVDTFGSFVAPGTKRVFFIASANPFGLNPSENCQLFSVDAFGRRLRQLTYLRQGDHSPYGCDVGGPPPGCAIHARAQSQDPVTETILFGATCDPFGTNLLGSHGFAIRPDGTGLRQLYGTRGLVTEPDGTVVAELTAAAG